MPDKPEHGGFFLCLAPLPCKQQGTGHVALGKVRRETRTGSRETPFPADIHMSLRAACRNPGLGCRFRKRRSLTQRCLQSLANLAGVNEQEATYAHPLVIAVQESGPKPGGADAISFSRGAAVRALRGVHGYFGLELRSASN